VKPSDDREVAHPVEPTVERVLVVDPDPMARDALCRFLDTHGHAPIEAASADEATAVMASTSIGALVLELKVPDRGAGLRMLSELRRDPAFSAVPLIVVSSTTLSAEQHDVVAAHKAFLFHKPDGLTALIGFLRRLTGGA
jgi:DNA-binding response OmpR family regulator